VLVVVVILLNLPVPATRYVEAGSQDAAEPFQSLFSALSYRVHGFISSSPKGGHPDRFEDLLLKVAELEKRLASVEELERSNAELRRGLGFAESSAFSLIPCRVIGRDDASGWWKVIRLNRGLADGVETNLAVISVDGLVGRVQRVSSGASDVLLLTDSTSKVSVRLPRQQSYGILQGMGPSITHRGLAQVLYQVNLPRLDYLDKNADVQDKDEVLTSGLGGVYPAGLRVGYIQDARLNQSGLYLSANLIPAANFNELRYVFVIKPDEEGGIHHEEEEVF
jgi:rod shape-determining protein MreC